jgi:hypothetical protein
LIIQTSTCIYIFEELKIPRRASVNLLLTVFGLAGVGFL